MAGLLQQILSKRYIKQANLSRLLDQLFGQDYEIEVHQPSIWLPLYGFWFAFEMRRLMSIGENSLGLRRYLGN